MHFIDIKPRDNNKEIYKINTLLNTIVQFEAAHAKREIPQCTYALPKIWTHKNYCTNNPRCVKCTEEHLTNECPRKVRDENVTCVNCNEKHPVNYRGLRRNNQQDATL
jgi:PAX-interacting protein 1